MKLVRNENGKEIVYVATSDILYLNKVGLGIPFSLCFKSHHRFEEARDESIGFDYIAVDDPEDIKYIKSLDFILDYEEYNNLSLKEIGQRLTKFGIKIGGFLIANNAESRDDIVFNYDLLFEYNKLVYQYQAISELYAVKKEASLGPISKLFRRKKKQR